MADTQQIPSLLQQAVTLLNQRQPQQVLQLLQPVCTPDCSEPKLWFLLGAAQAECGLMSDAEQSFRNVLEIDDGNIDARANLGRALAAQKKYSQSIEPLTQALEVNPSHHVARLSLIDSLTQLQKYDEAEKLCQQMMGNLQQKPDALLRLGHIKMLKNEIQEAISLFDQAQQLNPNSPLPIINKGLAQQKTGNIDGAIEQFIKVTEQFPTMDAAWNFLGISYLAKADLNNAIASFEKTLQINPAHLEAADQLAKLYRHVGRDEESIEVYKKILEIQPDHTRAKYFLEAYTSQDKNQKPDRIPLEITMAMYQDEDAGRRFDDSLKNALDYKAPDVLNEAIREKISIPEQGLDILELGCGSGLCGSKLSDVARKLVGTDLSPSMLTAAAEKNTYDELYQGDLIEVLSKNIDNADLIIAMDVLCFFGDLGEVFEKASKSLRGEGVFGFSVVKPDTDENWHLNRYGHFAHSPEHLDDSANKAGFKRVYLHEMVMRREVNEDRYGYICLYQRYES